MLYERSQMVGNKKLYNLMVAIYMLVYSISILDQAGFERMERQMPNGTGIDADASLAN